MNKKNYHKTELIKRKQIIQPMGILSSFNHLQDDITQPATNDEQGIDEQGIDNKGVDDQGINNQGVDDHEVDNGLGYNSLYDNDNDFLILSNLTVLSKIQKYDKLIIIKYKEKANEKIDFEIKIDNTYIKSISRWLFGHTRHMTIDYINKLIDIAIGLYYENSNNNIIMTMNKYVLLLENAKLGLSNLKFTYNYDQTIISNLDVIIEKIDMFRVSLKI
jgi:hypothetical protein